MVVVVMMLWLLLSRFAVVRRQVELLRGLKESSQRLNRVLPESATQAITTTAAARPANDVPTPDAPDSIVVPLLAVPCAALAAEVVREARGGRLMGGADPHTAVEARVTTWCDALVRLQQLCSRVVAVACGEALSGADGSLGQPLDMDDDAEGNGGDGGGSDGSDDGSAPTSEAAAAYAWTRLLASAGDSRGRHNRLAAGGASASDQAVGAVGRAALSHATVLPCLVDAALGLLRLQSAVAPTLFAPHRRTNPLDRGDTSLRASVALDATTDSLFVGGGGGSGDRGVASSEGQPHSFVRALTVVQRRVTDTARQPDGMASVGYDALRAVTEALHTLTSTVRAWLGYLRVWPRPRFAWSRRGGVTADVLVLPWLRVVVVPAGETATNQPTCKRWSWVVGPGAPARYGAPVCDSVGGHRRCARRWRRRSAGVLVDTCRARCGTVLGAGRGG